MRHEVERFCAAAGLSQTAAGEVGLCVNEGMANVTRHAYGGATDRPVAVEASLVDHNVVVTIRDWGSAPTPPAQPAHDPLKPGGLGLVCLRTLMDDVQFSPQPDGMLLTMKRKLPHE